MSIRERLDRYWFEPARLRDLAYLRIAVVFALLTDALWPGTLALELRRARLPAEWFTALPALKVEMLPFGWGARPGATLLVIAWIVCGVTGIGALLGAYTRLSLIVFAPVVTLLLAHVFSYGTMRHPQAAATIVLWLLILTPCGAELSIDAIRARVARSRARGRFVEVEEWARSRDARWPMRLVQWLLVSVYLSAALSKITVGKGAWLNGYTMTYDMLLDGIGHALPMTLSLAHVHWLGILIAALVLAFEATFVLCVLYPRLVLVYLAAGVAMHISIAVLMVAPFFQLMSLYAAFAEPVRTEVRRWHRAGAGGGSRVWTLVYDGYCPLCIRTMSQLAELDGAKRLRYVDLERDAARATELLPGVSADDMREEMAVVTPDGRALRGFFAFREISRRLPVLWPLVPLMYAPGSAWAGTRLYAWVAANRARRLCEGDACAVHGSAHGGKGETGVGSVIDFGGSAS
ncbi:MAG: DCC1-like thiol-disulfide oxidoreductase family protein [Gemmatimonadaceae bacterium]